MSENPLTGPNLVAFKCSDELQTMLNAAARFEKRNVSDLCRVALYDFFAARGYFEPEMLEAIAKGNDQK